MAGTKEANESTATAKGGKLRLMLIGLGALLLLGGGGAAAAYFTGLIGSGAAAEVVAPTHAEGGHEQPVQQPPQVFFVDMPDMIVNLQAPGPRMRFLKLRVSLEAGSEAAAQTFRDLMPRLLDGFQLYLRALTVEDVAGPGGMQRLKEDLVARGNVAVDPARIADVLIKEMLVQ